MEYRVGQKIYFKEEKKPYKIRACDERFLICTKPYNFRKETVIYTIVDLKENVRGRDGYAFGPYSYYKQDDCDIYLKELQKGAKIEEANDIVFKTHVGMIEDVGAGHVSYRHRIPLNIEKIA